MSTKHIFSLNEVMDFHVLQEILDHFFVATGMAANIVDYQGKIITPNLNFTRFCEKTRQDPKLRCRCEQSDAYGGIEAVRRGAPHIYRCHMGLVDVYVPVVVNGQYLGGIMTGQVLIEEEQLAKLEQIVKPMASIQDYPHLERLYHEVQTIPLRKVRASASLLFTMANYLTQKSMATVFEQQLNAQNAQLMQESKTRSVLEQALKDAEQKLLTSRINPHFLFNSLNTVSRQAQLEGASKTMEIVFALAELLRGSIRNNGQLGTLREELAYIRNYLFIKETRFGERVKAEIDVDESCLDSEIPLFTLQPLVENALIHGVEPKEEGGCIRIKVAREGKKICLSITDDGLGMSQDVIEEIMNFKSPVMENGSKLTGVGMSYVFKRLQYHFGNDFKWDLTSKIGEGTRITLLLPYRRWEAI